MLIAKMSKAELELLSYNDLTELILKEENKPMSTSEIFKKICKVLGYTESDFENKIGDYYTSLTTDKRFALVDNTKWNLREKHAIPLDLEEDEDEEIVDDIDEEEEEEENIDDEEDVDNLVEDDEDDLEDLTIIDEEEIDQ